MSDPLKPDRKLWIREAASDPVLRYYKINDCLKVTENEEVTRNAASPIQNFLSGSRGSLVTTRDRCSPTTTFDVC